MLSPLQQHFASPDRESCRAIHNRRLREGEFTSHEICSRARLDLEDGHQNLSALAVDGSVGVVGMAAARCGKIGIQGRWPFESMPDTPPDRATAPRGWVHT